MSHITTIKLVIKDLATLEAACAELGAQLVRNVPKYTWYGQKVGDDPLPEGMTLEDLGKCDHVIRLPGVQYEIGVVASKTTPGSYTLAWDFWGAGVAGSRHDGLKLQKHFGNNLVRLQDAYGAHTAMQMLRQKGYTPIRKTLPNGSIQVTCAA
jgi:hypothetical protein